MFSPHEEGNKRHSTPSTRADGAPVVPVSLAPASPMECREGAGDRGPRVAADTCTLPPRARTPIVADGQPGSRGTTGSGETVPHSTPSPAPWVVCLRTGTEASPKRLHPPPPVVHPTVDSLISLVSMLHVRRCGPIVRSMMGRWLPGAAACVSPIMGTRWRRQAEATQPPSGCSPGGRSPGRHARRPAGGQLGSPRRPGARLAARQGGVLRVCRGGCSPPVLVVQSSRLNHAVNNSAIESKFVMIPRHKLKRGT